MIYKNKFLIKMIGILICVITTSFFGGNIKCRAETIKTLILYDENKEYGQETNRLNDLTKNQLANGKEVTIRKINSNNLNDLEAYDEIYVLNINGTNKEIKNLKDSLQSYGKMVNWIKNDFNNSSNANKENSHSKSEIYFYLSNVTPFNDLNNLIDEMDYLKKNGIKFFIEASPVFINENQKAMGKFAECLRYGQANGGKVILSFPILNTKMVYGKSISEQVITEKVKSAFNNYINYWVYPVGMNINESLLYREDLKNLLECTDTLFLTPENNIDNDVDNYTIKYRNNIIQKINLEDYNKNIYGKSAICVDSSSSFEDFKKNVDKILEQEVNLAPNDKLTSYLKFDSEIKSSTKGIFFNNEDVTQQRFIDEKEYKKAFAISSEQENSIKTDLTDTNRKLEIVSGISLIIFIIILIVSKNIERKRFFK